MPKENRPKTLKTKNRDASRQGDIVTTFKAFKRQFHKVRKVYDILSTKGSFGFQIKTVKDKLMMKTHTPDESTTIRFVVLMRPFLRESSPQFIKNLWSIILKEFPEELERDDIECIERMIHDLKKGDFEIKINDESLFSEKCYQLVANGNYFIQNKKYEEYLNKLNKMTPLGPMVLYQFYSYSLKAFEIVSVLCQCHSKYREKCEVFKNSWEGKRGRARIFLPDYIGVKLFYYFVLSNDRHILQSCGGNNCPVCRIFVRPIKIYIFQPDIFIYRNNR